ncbi:MAG TPA: valine--tRNA ligase [Caulobacteraceae bacterium]
MLDKTFDPKTAEPRIYQRWESSGGFAPIDDPAAEPFCIVIPPPNVTGSLHVGHALNNTLQDVLIRFERMRGKAALWLPGTDHAGIATQMVVERQLAEQGNVGRRELGREAFVEKVWAWKAQSGGTIVRQLRRLGASCDWSHERFTLDEGLSAAVRKVFVTLHKQGLIYRDKRLVNWDPELQTAISDLEVEQREVDGHFWNLAYPLADGPVNGIGEIVVATTRPETMLGDTAVAVHPGDERYKALVGKLVAHPITGRRIPIIADDYADPEKGSGAVKITPAHDFNDFKVGQRHGLALINILDDRARILARPEHWRRDGDGAYEREAAAEVTPLGLGGVDRFQARAAIVAEIERLELLRGIEKTRHVVPHGDRSGVVVEPFLTDQWYVDAKTLAQPAIKAVEQGDTVFIPKNWEKTYFEWLRNIEPWCISRQLWWGHRIPAWYGPDGEIFVEETEEAARQAAGGVALRQDEDVLDTWFSSALWPFSTLGWPGETADLKRFYPTSILVTGFDIIFFWVARMMMMGLHFMDEVPFRRVFINALVRDERGKKMSKSKGNVVDPLEMVEELGADALRFTLTAMSGQGRNIALSQQRVEGYRNFGTKLWNAARFCQLNECRRAEGFDPGAVQLTLNRWIRGEAARTAREATQALEACGFDDAAAAVYRFVRNVFCDWYLELAKPVLNGADEAAKAETRATAAWVLDVALKLLHPICPFITEELWVQLADFGAPREPMLMTARWPQPPDAYIDAEAGAEMDWLIELVSEVRSIRSEMNVPPGARLPMTVSAADETTRQRLARYGELARTLARLSGVEAADAPGKGAAPFVVGGATYALQVSDFVDLAAERVRLGKEIGALASDIDRTAKKLGNPDFVARAPEEVVEENRERLAEAEAAKAKLEAALQRLQTVG